MPSSVVAHTGALPLGSLFSSKSKHKYQLTPPPLSAYTLHFDSTRLLSGLLSSSRGIEYAIATRGTKTVISCPERSRDVAVIEWKQGWVETEGLRLGLNEWLDGHKWGYSNTHTFKKWGDNPVIKWDIRGGNWRATNSQKQTLATFIVRRGTLISRIELTNIGKPYTDALVLTGILSVAGKKEWKWNNYLQDRRDAIEAGSRGSEEGIMIGGLMAGNLSDEALPTYREAPFTRRLGSIPYSLSSSMYWDDESSCLISRPPSFTLSSERLRT